MVETIKILADITRRDVERSLFMDEDTFQNVTARYSERYGWHLKRIDEVESNCWQDDTQ
jgi:hypothetical protein